jgi:hypothetical protein
VHWLKTGPGVPCLLRCNIAYKFGFTEPLPARVMAMRGDQKRFDTCIFESISNPYRGSGSAD